jgi:hypothetical protein
MCYITLFPSTSVTDVNKCNRWNITQVCDQKTFLTRVAVSYAFFPTDNGKNSEKVSSRTVFAQISIFNFPPNGSLRGTKNHLNDVKP